MSKEKETQKSKYFSFLLLWLLPIFLLAHTDFHITAFLPIAMVKCTKKSSSAGPSALHGGI
jgi:hypothetical protein